MCRFHVVCELLYKTESNCDYGENASIALACKTKSLNILALTNLREHNE